MKTKEHGEQAEKGQLCQERGLGGEEERNKDARNVIKLLKSNYS